MALRFTPPLVQIGTMNLPGGKAWSVRKANILTAICEQIA
jgi:hypothetical protein